jgi:antirestriction protein ArdC
MPQTTNTPSFTELLQQATTEPGTVSQAYSAFHGYSLGNQIHALLQCHARGIAVGPIASFNRWKELGRHVVKGQKAIELCMPVTCKRAIEQTDDAGHATTDEATFTRFIYRRNWFVLAQTDGQPYTPPAPAGWDRARALAALDITEEPFAMLDGNCQGYAHGRAIAVSAIAAHPFKTTFHELAHVIIGHTAEAEMRDDERTPRNVRELEAEATAMLCCAALDLPGVEESRGYIQNWYGTGQPVPETSARHIFKAADAILRAGREEPSAHGPTTDPVHHPGEPELSA